MTKALQVDENWVKVKDGNTLFQVKRGEVMVFVGTDMPTDTNAEGAFLVDNVFKYIGTESVYVRAAKRSIIVYDDQFGN